jgi:hypothetical protein
MVEIAHSQHYTHKQHEPLELYKQTSNGKDPSIYRGNVSAVTEKTCEEDTINASKPPHQQSIIQTDYANMDVNRKKIYKNLSDYRNGG